MVFQHFKLVQNFTVLENVVQDRTSRKLDVDDDLPVALDVLLDMVTASLVTDADTDAERPVVLEEIAMNDDDPGDTVHELFSRGMWLPHPVGRPVLGSVASIESMPSHQLRLWYRTRYDPSHLVIAAAGNLEHAALVRLVRQAIAQGMLTVSDDAHPAPPRSRTPRTD